MEFSCEAHSNGGQQLLWYMVEVLKITLNDYAFLRSMKQIQIGLWYSLSSPSASTRRTVGTDPPLLVATTAFMEKQLNSGLESVENGFGKHFTWYAQESAHARTCTRTQTHIHTMMGTETSLALPG